MGRHLELYNLYTWKMSTCVLDTRILYDNELDDTDHVITRIHVVFEECKSIKSRAEQVGQVFDELVGWSKTVIHKPVSLRITDCIYADDRRAILREALLHRYLRHLSALLAVVRLCGE